MIGTHYNNQITSKPKEILQAQAEYFERLYKIDKVARCEIQFGPPKKVTNENMKKIDQPISIEEIGNAIKSMAKKKSPGSDGFQADWYVVFWLKIKDILFEAYKYCLLMGRMSITQRQGIITLIPKRNRDLLWVQSYRPIVLLNTDYKILSKVTATRIKHVLEDIIDTDQNGFLKGRNISNNLQILLDVMEWADMQQIPGLLISIDFEKAFDKVQYESLWYAMK